MFSSRSSMVSGFTFTSLIHFEFIFVYGEIKLSNLILAHVNYPVFPTPLNEEAFRPHPTFLSSSSQAHCPCKCGFISGLCSAPLIYMSTLLPKPHCLDLCRFIISLEIRYYTSSKFVFLSQDCFSYSRTQAFSHTLQNQPVNFFLKCWDFDWSLI